MQPQRSLDPVICCIMSTKSFTDVIFLKKQSRPMSKQYKNDMSEIGKKSVPGNATSSTVGKKQQCLSAAIASENSSVLSPKPKINFQGSGLKENNEVDNNSNCGEYLEKLLDGLSDQSLLDLCKDAGLLPSSPLRFPVDASSTSITVETSSTSVDFQSGEDVILVDDDDQPSLSSPQSLENMKVDDISLLDDICKLIDCDLNGEVAFEISEPPPSQVDSITSQNPMLLGTKTSTSQNDTFGLHENQQLPAFTHPPTPKYTITLPQPTLSNTAVRVSSTPESTPKSREKFREKCPVVLMENIAEVKKGKKAKRKAVKKEALQRHVQFSENNFSSPTLKRDWSLNLRQFFQSRQRVPVCSVRSFGRTIVNLDSKLSIDLTGRKKLSFSKNESNLPKIKRSKRFQPSLCSIISAKKALLVSQSVAESLFSSGSPPSLNSKARARSPVKPTAKLKPRVKKTFRNFSCQTECSCYNHSDLTRNNSTPFLSGFTPFCQFQTPCYCGAPHQTNPKMVRPESSMRGPCGVFHQWVPVVRFSGFPGPVCSPTPFSPPGIFWNGYRSTCGE